ncbi:uncharacterized protein LOC105687622 [Athalia rosae]|uniref:uncharacterized protein LOC105687622 n=1 Tax=Athalia rosae TaxID=37344 RepID=UPI0020342D3B|nr:uncharacterized protein LOC105687622 [Athalia rosae]
METTGGCVGSKKEQLYMLELLVDKLNLSADKIREIGSAPLCVRLKFVDFPPFEISQAEFVKQKVKEPSVTSERTTAAEYTVDFSAGKSCLFTKQPRDLVQAMQSRPLQVGVYRTIAKAACGAFVDDLPICETRVPLSGCLCDQVAMAMNDADHLPKPYTLKNTYNLLDDKGSPSGTIAIFLRLSCFGKSIVTHFTFQERSFLFKSSESSDEFQCTRVPPTEEELARRANEVKDKICVSQAEPEPEEDPLPKPSDVIGLAPICQELAKRDGGPANLYPPISAPLRSPKIPMDHPDFEKLTSAEKLNDKSYRGLVYREHTNEKICECACSPGGIFLNRLTGDFPCTGAACGGGICVGTRRLDPPPRDHHGGSDEMPCYTGNCCSGTPKSSATGDISYGGCCNGTRMRGGGCCDGMNSGTGPPGGLDVSENRVNPFHRNRSINADISGACTSSQGGEGSSKKPGCGCYGKSGTGEMQTRPALGKAGGSCSKRPCLGVDCLLRAFKETQDFVDSIGKVPGLAGLGLPDPSESPYFGRDRDDVEDTCAPKKTPGIGSSRHLSTTSASFATRNQNFPKAPRSTGGINFPPLPNPFPSIIPGRTGVVREAITASPEIGSFGTGRGRRKDDRSEKQKEMEMSPMTPMDIEFGPCGEPRCKARRKKTHNDPHQTGEGHSGLSLSKKLPVQVRPNSGGGFFRIGGGRSSSKFQKHTSKTPQTVLGPFGDRNLNSKSYVKVSRRVMKFVYSTGASYPGINYGHKNCLDNRMRVPANMGWLWNTNQVVGRLKPRLGWKPGAISRFMNELLRQAKVAGSTESRPTSSSSKSKKGKMLKNKSRSSPSVNKGLGTKKKDGEDEETELPPTLHIHRKDGTYYVTMYPIKQETMDVPQLQEPMKPLQFKITKNKDDASIASSSTASDMEIEFSPPAAVNRYRKKPNVIHVTTQVKQQEIIDALKPPGSKKGKREGKGAGKKGKKK